MSDLTPVFRAVRGILAPYSSEMMVKKDSATDFHLDTKHFQKNKTPVFFGAARVMKSFVSFRLMPVYVQPSLLESISPELRKRMQGKSCFNFSVVDEKLFKELAVLTKAGYASYKEQGLV